MQYSWRGLVKDDRKTQSLITNFRAALHGPAKFLFTTKEHLLLENK